MTKVYSVAVVGATGAVGEQIILQLEQSDLPIATIKFLSSPRSAGSTLSFKNEDVIVEEAKPESFTDVDIAIFSAGGSISEKLAPEAVKRGAIVIDNTSHFRMAEDVPLVVPEVNEEALRTHNGIIANPNCSTIQMVAALEPIRKKHGLKRVIVSTYQAVSGAGNLANQELFDQTRAVLDNKPVEANILPASGDKKHYQIAFNAIPQIDVFGEDDYTYEEHKMINETKKIMSDATLKVAATCVRLPISRGHSESVYFEIDNDNVSAADIKEILSAAPGIVLEDDPATQTYPQALNCVDKRETFVGRVRRDLDEPKGFHMWVVSDNLLKGAAWNSVQIAERLVALNII